MKQKSRDAFNTRAGFLLACIGSSVGMGNIWRFPVMVSKYGGLTFLLPFLLFVCVIAASGATEEFALGRSTGSGPIGAFGACTKLRFGNEKIGKIIGNIPVIGAIGMAIGYACIMAWTFKYAFMAITGQLLQMGQDTELIVDTFNQTSSAFGANLWICIAVLVCFVIMIGGIANGIEIANKVMMPFLFGLFLVLAIYISFLPGAEGGYKYIFTLDVEGLCDIEVWIFAFGQAFFSLSICGGGSVVYGSYLSKDVSIPRAAQIIALFDIISAMLSSFVILPAMATCNVELTQGGPGLMFIYLVQVINAMPGGYFVAIAFFVAVIFAGISSIINMYETAISFLQDEFGVNRKISTTVILAFGCICAIFVQALTSEWMDVMSVFICPLGAFLAGIMFYWIAGKKFVLKAINEGSNHNIGPWFYPFGKYIYCTLAFLVLVLGIIFGGIG